MSGNQGKDGEMVVAVIAASIGYHEDGVDFTRPSITNSADMGSDIFLRHPPKFLDKLLQVANGTFLPPSSDAKNNGEPKVPVAKSLPTQSTRIDVKRTSGKLGAPTVDKFIADIPKHPGCTGHLLAGGSGLTKNAEIKLAQAQQNFQSNGLTIAYLSNAEVGRLGGHYLPPPPRLDPGNGDK